MVSEPRKREGQQLLLRFPARSNLRDKLDAVARANNRTLTAEIIHRLEMSFLEKRLYDIEGTAGAAFELATDLAFKDLAAVIQRLDDHEKRLTALEKRPVK